MWTQPSVGGHSSMPQARIEVIKVAEGQDFPLGWGDQVMHVVDVDDTYEGTAFEVTIVRRPN